MGTAYTNAAGRTNPDFTELGAGSIGGMTLVAGLYKWGGNVLIASNLALTGSATDVYIFQIAGMLNLSSGVQVTLAGGLVASNIFWQVALAVELATTSHMEGTILTMTKIDMLTGSSINGRLLAQTAANLQISTINIPTT